MIIEMSQVVGGFDLRVPLLLVLAVLAFGLGMLPTHVVAGRLLVVGKVSHDVRTRLGRRHISRLGLTLYVSLGVAAGLTAGALLAVSMGLQGWLLGLTLSVLGGIYPLTRYQDGWDKRYVERLNGDTLMLLRRVYTLSGVGTVPVSHAVRRFAETKADDSELAQLLARCPLNADPADYLADVQVPGRPLVIAVMALHQASGADRQKREQILERNLDIAVTQLENELNAMANRRAMTAILVSVLILLPTLLLAILGPQLVSLLGALQ